MKTKTEIKELAKDLIQDSLSSCYYKVADNPSSYELTEDEALEVSNEINRICAALCKRMGREHYTV